MGPGGSGSYEVTARPADEPLQRCPRRSTCQRKDTTVDRKKGQTAADNGTNDPSNQRSSAHGYSQSKD
jgi:hypothetical protein